MPSWLENLLVVLAVTGCAVLVVRQIIGELSGKKPSACSGCTGGCMQPRAAKPQDCPSCRTVFLPVDELRKSGR